MKTTRKLFALVLCMCMVLSCVPVMQASAAEVVSNEPFEIYNENSEPKGWEITSLSDNGLDEAGANWADSYSFGIVEEADGNKAIAINKNAIGYGALMTPAMAVTEGANYRLQFAYRNAYTGIVEGTDSMHTFWGMRVTVHFYDTNGDELTSAYKTINHNVVGKNVSDTWSKVTYDFAAVPGAVTAKVFFGLGGEMHATAQMLIDDFDLRTYNNGEVANSDFSGIVNEADGARPISTAGPGLWSMKSVSISGDKFNSDGYQNNYIASTVTENGNSFLELKPNTTVRGYAVVHSNYIKAESGATYTLRYDQKTTGSDVDSNGEPYRGAIVFLYYYDAQMNLLGNRSQPQGAVMSAQDWTTKTFTTAAIEGTAYIGIGFYIGGQWGTSGDFAYYYDNVSLTKVDFNGNFESVDAANAPYSWTKTSMTSGSQIETNNNWAANYTLSAAAGQGVDGGTAASLTKNSTGYAAMTSIPVAVQAGKNYRVSYTYKTTSIIDAKNVADYYGVHAAVQCLDADGNQVGWIILNNTGVGKGQTVSSAWETVNHDFTAPAGTANVRLYLSIGGIYYVKATTLFDNVSVTEYATDTIVNADFEGTVNQSVGGRNQATEGPSGWTIVSTNGGGEWNSASTDWRGNYAVTTQVLDDGNKVMKLAPCTSSTGTRGYIVAHSQPIAVESATSYTLSFEQKVDVGEPTYDAKILFYYFDENMEFLSGDWMRSSNAAHDWENKSVTATTRANTAYVIVGLYIGGGWDQNAGIAYYYDNLQLKKQATTYTVSYVIDEEIVDQYIVEKGGDVPANVKITNKPGYVGTWDHDGTNITADTTITAVYTPKAQIEGYRLVLGDDIGVYFYAKAVEGQEKNVSVKITIGSDSVTTKLSQLTAEEDLYAVRANVAAAQMCDEILVEVLADNVVIDSGVYSVAEYACYILDEANGFEEKDKQLVKEMLNYGAAAQDYFSYNPENKVDNALFAGAGANEIDGTNVADMVIGGSADGIRFYGASLVFESKVAVRFYFTVEGDINNYTFSTGKDPVEKDGLYYVEVAGINPQDYAEVITLTVNDTLAISYSPMNYIVRKGANGSEGLKVLLKAMYNYYLAAADYVK